VGITLSLHQKPVAKNWCRTDTQRAGTQAPLTSHAHRTLGTHAQRGRGGSPQEQPPPCRSRPSHGLAAHTISGENRRAGQIRRANNHSHTQAPPRTLAALRSAGTVRHASTATARSTHTTKEARGWAIGGRHGQMCARMCGLPHFPHDVQIPNQNFTMLPSLRRLVLYLYSVFICQMTVMSFSPDKTRGFLPALHGDKYVDLMVVP